MIRLLLLLALNAAAADTPKAVKVLHVLPEGVADAALTMLATPAESSVNLWSIETGKQLGHYEIPVIPNKGPNDWNQIYILSVRPDLGVVLVRAAHNYGGTEKYSALKHSTDFYLLSTTSRSAVKKIWGTEGPCINGGATFCTGGGRFQPLKWFDSNPAIVHLLVTRYFPGHLDDLLYRSWHRLTFDLNGKKLFEDETVRDNGVIVKGADKADPTMAAQPYFVVDAQSCIVKIEEKQVSFLAGCVENDYPRLSLDDKRASSLSSVVYKSWDIATGALTAKFGPEIPKNENDRFTWSESPDGRIAILNITRMPDAVELQVWDARSGKQLSTFIGPELKGSSQFETNGRLAIFNKDSYTTIIDLGLSDGPAAPVAAAAAKLDVDALPSASSALNPEAFAVVIGVEKYRQTGVPVVDYASRDAKTMAAYLGTMGFDPKNVAVLTDAQAGKVDFDKYFGKWLKNRVGPKSRVFVYYAGHGAPNPTTGAGYLMPYEADPAYLEETAYPVTQLYAELAKLPTKDVTVVLDACFSGQGERSLIAKGTRPLVAVQKTAGPENAAVIAAASGSQISASDHEARHGLLTYHLLAGLHGDADANKDGSITTSELFAYARPAVERAAKLQNVEQTPTVSGDTGAAGARVWTTLKKP